MYIVILKYNKLILKIYTLLYLNKWDLKTN